MSGVEVLKCPICGKLFEVERKNERVVTFPRHPSKALAIPCFYSGCDYICVRR